MSINFQAYLSKIDSSQTYQCQSLAGGLVNFTVRASKSSSSNGGLFPNHETLILKYAPPYVAVLGEEAPFSQDRQLMEARALALFVPQKGPLSSLGQSASVKVPGLLHHSPDDHVLVLEDLGPLLTLCEYLNTCPPNGDITCRKLGSRIGDFFARLHSPEAFTKAQEAVSGDLENPVIASLLLEEAVMPIESLLRSHGILNAQLLYRRARSDFEREDTPTETCFVLGDFTPGAVLVSKSDESPQVMGVIDWEFSGKGRGANGDMAQVLASLHVSLMAHSPNSSYHRAVLTLIQGICISYSDTTRTLNEKLPATDEMTSGLRVRNMTKSTKPSDSSIFRSALILHGREMINQAVEQEWKCATPEENAALVRKMVGRGAWYLERAGDDAEAMLESQNWEEMLKEENQIMLSLFGLSGYTPD